jgi:hypothetical protein
LHPRAAVIWLTGKLEPDFKTIADFRHDNPEAIGIACHVIAWLSTRQC